jgi:uncharacterized membrane protein
MNKFDKIGGQEPPIVPARMMSWSRAIGSYTYASICGVGMGMVMIAPGLNVVWKVCFAVAFYLAAAVMYLWVVMIPPGAAPVKKQARATELFSLACARGNIDAAASMLETFGIPDSLLQTEASRLYGSHDATSTFSPNFRMAAWLIGRLCKKAPSLLWQTQDPSWSNIVDRWALGPDAVLTEGQG